MRFGPQPVADALGATLAHSVQLPSGRLRKGRVLERADIDALTAAGIDQVTVARLNKDDIAEDAAAAAIAAALMSDAGPGNGLTIGAPFNGRVNLLSAHLGLARIDVGTIAALNRIDPGITIATLPDHARVQAGSVVATIKVIPYAVPALILNAALEVASSDAKAMTVQPVVIQQADIILTRTPGFADRLLDKGRAAIATRLAALGIEIATTRIVDHDQSDVAAALEACDAPLVLILGASATSDELDVCPAGLVAAGGRLTRFGMPVDPGNLLFLGRLGMADVIGLPGCARSPALNGADWVLERIVCGIAVTSDDIAAMGVGGLLKEIPIRPQPRAGQRAAEQPRIDVVVLAAGASRRMRGADKLIEQIDGVPILTRVVKAATASQASRTHVVLPPDAAARRQALSGLDVSLVTALDAAEGMAASLRAGLRRAAGADAVIVMLADMPEVTTDHLNRLIAGFDPNTQAEICRSVSDSGQPGHPVLFGQRFFESLAALTGDQGARSVVAAAEDYLIDVDCGPAATLDLDTPEQWDRYLAGLTS